jgi:hypothetical protein
MTSYQFAILNDNLRQSTNANAEQILLLVVEICALI